MDFYSVCDELAGRAKNTEYFKLFVSRASRLNNKNEKDAIMLIEYVLVNYYLDNPNIDETSKVILFNLSRLYSRIVFDDKKPSVLSKGMEKLMLRIESHKFSACHDKYIACIYYKLLLAENDTSATINKYKALCLKLLTEKLKNTNFDDYEVACGFLIWLGMYDEALRTLSQYEKYALAIEEDRINKIKFKCSDRNEVYTGACVPSDKPSKTLSPEQLRQAMKDWGEDDGKPAKSFMEMAREEGLY